MKAVRIEKDDWYDKYAGAHQKIFAYGLDEAHLFDFVLGMFDDSDDLCGYISVCELDSESAFVFYGGMFMHARGIGKATEGFGVCIIELMKKYKRVGLLTENKNKIMINLGHKLGFDIVGLRQVRGVPCVEMLLEFN